MFQSDRDDANGRFISGGRGSQVTAHSSGIATAQTRVRTAKFVVAILTFYDIND